MVYFGSIRFILTIFVPYSPHLFYSVQYVHFSLIWSCLVHSVYFGPILLFGRLRSYYVKCQSKAGNLDQIGCVKHWNEVAKDKVFQLRTQLPNATFTYVDVHSAKSALISNAKNEGNLNLLYNI